MRNKIDTLTIGLFLFLVLAFILYFFYGMITIDLGIANFIKTEVVATVSVVTSAILVFMRIFWKASQYEKQNKQLFERKSIEEGYNVRMDVKDATINNLIKLQDKYIVDINTKLDEISILLKNMKKK